MEFKNKCDCAIGYYFKEDGERFIHFDDIKVETMGALTSIVDDSKNQYFKRFEYCPFCGEKLNWSEIKSKCQDTLAQRFKNRMQ